MDGNLYLLTMSFTTSMTFTPLTGPIIRAVKPPNVVEIPKSVTLQPRPQLAWDKIALRIIAIFVVAMVIIPTMAALIYVLVHSTSFDGEPPSVEITRTLIVNPFGYKFAMTGPRLYYTVTWTDFTVILKMDVGSATWDDALQSSLTGGSVMTRALGPRYLGGSWFFVNVTDRGGNGAVDKGDYFTITGSFQSGTKYTVILLYEPTNGKMGDTAWTPFTSDDSSMTIELLSATVAAVAIVVTVLLLLRRKRGQTKLPLPESKTR